MATVPEIITDQQAYTTRWLTQADGFINAVASLANTEFSVPASGLGYGRTGLTDGAESKLSALRPIRPTFSSVSATLPDAPEFTFSDVVPIAVLDFLASAPVLDIPAVPSNALPTAPTAPAIADPIFPDAPTVVLPTAPTITPPVLPEPPSIALPSFTSSLPIDDLVVPSNTFSFYEVAYSSSLLDAVKAKLLSDIENGGYGIDVADEVAVWERARAREVVTAQQQVDEIIRFHATRGFDLPPGELAVAASRAQQDLANRMSSISRDIAVKRADMFVENRKFTIIQSKELENILLNYHNSVMERALNVAKVTLDFSIQIFNASIARYNARVDSYKAAAQVFESQIRAALTQVEIYKATMEGKRLELDAQRVQVDIYNAQLAGINAVVNIYRTRMEAANIQAQVERTRLEAFRALIDAYGQQVQAKVSEFNMYRSQIEGEVAKVTAFRGQVDAYTAQVGAAKVKADIQVATLNAEVERARALLLRYQAQIAGYQADLVSQVDIIKTDAEIYRADISAFSTSVDALKSAYQLEVEELSSNAQWNIASANVNVAVARLNLDRLKAAADIRVHAAEFGSNFYANIIASTLGSINTLAAQIESS